MRVLLLVPYFFPYQNPRAYRWTAIAREWASEGWEVHAVCSGIRGRYEESMWEGVFLHPAGFNSAKEAAYAWFPSLPGRGVEMKPGKLSARMGMLNDWFLKSWYWPDDAWLWIGPARKKALHLLANDRFDALVSVSLPFSAHWAARSLKKRYPDLTWLADIGDPLVQTDHPLNNARLYDRKNRDAELAVLQSTDQVVVTNEGLRKAYLGAYPALRTPLNVIPPLASPVSGKTGESPGGRAQLHLGYFGSFFPRIREPESLLRFFEIFGESREDWTLHFYGAIFENFRPVFERFPQLKPRLQFHGMKSREDAIAAMQEMDILVMLGNTTSFQLPSKWADYLVAEKPVLHLTQSPDDPGLDWLSGVPWVLSHPLSAPFLLPDLDELSRRKPPQPLAGEWKRKLSPGTIAGAYAGLLAG